MWYNHTTMEMPKYQAIPQEKLSQIQALDQKASEMFTERERLAVFLKNYRRFIAQNPETKKRYTVKEMAEKFLRGSTVQEFISIPESVVAEMAKDLPEKQARVKKAVYIDRLRANFQQAINNAFELMSIESSATDSAQLLEHYGVRVKEIGTASQTLDNFASESEFINEVTAELLETSEFMDEADLLAISARQAELEALRSQENEYIRNNPEAFLLQGSRQLRQMKQAFDLKGKMVETPYVKNVLADIERYASNGDPIFIHGELGAGKTEIAKHAIRTKLSKKHLERWTALNPKPNDNDAQKLHEWENLRENQTEPIVVSGYRGIEAEAFLGERKISAGTAPAPEEQLEIINKGWEVQRDKIMEKAKDSAEGQEAFLQKAYHLYKDAYLKVFEKPIETRRIMGPLLQAMHEGRPIIIDEMNAIPHHVLIVLNEYLTKKSGDKIVPPFADMDAFTVKDGFCAIATGNYKPEDGALYPGRSPLDAALLSRFAIIHYDYLPQRLDSEVTGTNAETLREQRPQNELFSMLLTRLLDQNLSAGLPADAPESLQNLSRMARGIQNIFSKRDTKEVRSGGAKIAPQDILKENVLSIRHMLRILDNWKNEGYKYPIDYYIFQEYISRSSARPKEMEFLYQKFQIEGGFFDTANGWPSAMASEDLMTFKVESLKDRLRQNKVEIQRLSVKDCVELIYGPAPERTQMRGEFLYPNEAQADSEELSLADQLKLKKMIDQLKGKDSFLLFEKEYDDGT